MEVFMACQKLPILMQAGVASIAELAELAELAEFDARVLPVHSKTRKKRHPCQLDCRSLRQTV